MVTKFEHRNIASFIVSEVNSFLTKKRVVVPGERRELKANGQENPLPITGEDEVELINSIAQILWMLDQDLEKFNDCSLMPRYEDDIEPWVLTQEEIESANWIPDEYLMEAKGGENEVSHMLPLP